MWGELVKRGASWLGRVAINVRRVSVNVGRVYWGELAQIWGELVRASWFWGESTGNPWTSFYMD